MKLLTTLKNMFNAASAAARGTGTLVVTEKGPKSPVYGTLPAHERSVIRLAYVEHLAPYSHHSLGI